MPRIAYVDGAYVPLAEAAVSIEDRGFQFADGIYEVAAALNGRLFDWPQHAARLRRNLAQLSIAEPMSPKALELVGRRLLAKNGAAGALLYIQVTRGTSRRDHPFPAATRPTLVMTARPFD
ncbi:MAG: aminotransferase class IV, partial [Sphingomonadaceae bacterium]|nr:aminotransferase class IV [Sphingomonadaceae bacterium]